jgi:hypothetical protein
MEEAEKAFRRALAKDPDFLLARDRLENMSSTLLDRLVNKRTIWL